jgi:hypothetical protein
MCTADSWGAESDGDPSETDLQDLVDCGDCGDPTPPDDLEDGFCRFCRTQHTSDLGIGGDDEPSDGDDAEPRGSMLA